MVDAASAQVARLWDTGWKRPRMKLWILLLGQSLRCAGLIRPGLCGIIKASCGWQVPSTSWAPQEPVRGNIVFPVLRCRLRQLGGGLGLGPQGRKGHACGPRSMLQLTSMEQRRKCIVSFALCRSSSAEAFLVQDEPAEPKPQWNSDLASNLGEFECMQGCFQVATSFTSRDSGLSPELALRCPKSDNSSGSCSSWC